MGKYKEQWLTGAEIQEWDSLCEPVPEQKKMNYNWQIPGGSWKTELYILQGHPIILVTPQYYEIYMQEFDQIPTVNIQEKFL